MNNKMRRKIIMKMIILLFKNKIIKKTKSRIKKIKSRINWRLIKRRHQNRIHKRRQ